MKKIVGLLLIPTKYYLKISYQDAFSNSQYFPFSFFGGNVGGLSVIFSPPRLFASNIFYQNFAYLLILAADIILTLSTSKSPKGKRTSTSPSHHCTDARSSIKTWV